MSARKIRLSRFSRRGARAGIIVPIDGDLQNDPADIPRLLAKLDEGFDLDARIKGEGGNADRRAGVAAFVAEHLDHEIGGAVHHHRQRAEIGGGVDEATQTHAARDAVQVAVGDHDLHVELPVLAHARSDAGGAARSCAVRAFSP